MASKTGNSAREGTRADTPADFCCPDCGGKQVVQDVKKGDNICANCGLVLTAHHIDMGPEWRAFTAEERDARKRTGAPVNYAIHDKGLSTMIDWRNRDSSGRPLSAKRRARIYRLRKWQIRTRVHSGIERNLARGMSELSRLSSQLSVPRSIKELAAMLYREFIVKKHIRGKNIDATVAGAIYAACRLRKTPRSLHDIAECSRIDKKKIGRHYRMLAWKLDLQPPIPDPANHVPRIMSALELPGIVQGKALEVLDKAKEAHLTTGRDPRGLAAAGMYIASILTDNRLTQREIAAVAGITEVTLRNRYKEMVRELSIGMNSKSPRDDCHS